MVEFISEKENDDTDGIISDNSANKEVKIEN